VVSGDSCGLAEVAQSRRWAALKALAAGLALALLSAFVVDAVDQASTRQREMQVRLLATAVANDLAGRLDRSLSAAIALSAVLRQGGGRIDNFNRLAKELINQFGGISALQLAPGGTIAQVEPLAGNERAIGFSPLKDPVQGAEARRVVASRTLGLTGPFELRQGGVGVVGRNPVFMRDAEGREKFWGLVQVMIRVPDLLVMTRLDAIERAGLRYELWRWSPQGNERQVFARSSDMPLEKPVDISIPVPNGEWVLSVAPESGWHSRSTLVAGGAIGICLSLLGAVVVYLILRPR